MVIVDVLARATALLSLSGRTQSCVTHSIMAVLLPGCIQEAWVGKEHARLFQLGDNTVSAVAHVVLWSTGMISGAVLLPAILHNPVSAGRGETPAPAHTRMLVGTRCWLGS